MRSALALIGQGSHVLIQRMREAFHPVEIRQWNFPGLCLPPLENAFTHVCDNCVITSKTRDKNEEQSE